MINGEINPTFSCFCNGDNNCVCKKIKTIKPEIENYSFDDAKLETLKESNNKLKISNAMRKNIKKLVFVYSQPKVGSTSLVSSIRLSCSNSYFVVHLHNEIMLSVLYGINGVSINEIIYYNKIIGNEVFVIDVYRTPVERKISLFFEDISSFHFNNTDENVLNYKLSRVFDRFNCIYGHIANGDNFLEKYNIDCPTEFNYHQKYLLIESNGIKYIKLRLQDSNEWGKILSSILSCNINIVKDYETDKKGISALYNKFKNEYNLPVNYYYELEKCDYLKYFLSKKEREDYLAYWKSKLSSNFVGYTEKEYILYEDISNKNRIRLDVPQFHYIDEGCICKRCAEKRLHVVNSVDKEVEKVKHVRVHNRGIRVLLLSKRLIEENRAKVVNRKVIGSIFGR